MNEKDLLEKILTAQVLLLSKQIETETQGKGVRRLGGDYSHEAVKLLRDKQPHILQLLRENQG